jgi:site-specific DNA-methyltransferase (adenine-specific)
LVQADAREFLPSLPGGSADLIVTDPPYVFDRGDTYFAEWFEELDDEAWPQIFAELHRVLHPNSHAYVFADRRVRPLFESSAQGAGFRAHQALIWDKGSIGLGQSVWRPQHEYICFFSKGSRAGNSKSLGDVLRAPRPRGYPTEKPLAVLKTLIAQSSDRGELVLDPFCGSGNVGRAARDLGRRALLCDIDAAFAAGRLRLGFAEPTDAKT